MGEEAENEAGKVMGSGAFMLGLLASPVPSMIFAGGEMMGGAGLGQKIRSSIVKKLKVKCLHMAG